VAYAAALYCRNAATTVHSRQRHKYVATTWFLLWLRTTVVMIVSAHSFTSCRVIIAWYIRVKTESVVRRHLLCHSSYFLCFQTNNVGDASYSLWLVFCPSLILHSGRENDHGNIRCSRPLAWMTCRYRITLPQPTAGPASGQAVPAALSMWAVHLSSLYSSFSAHVEWPACKSELLSPFAVVHVREYTLEVP
jgi:hypothetical protein